MEPATPRLPLERAHPHYRDTCVAFDARTHTYTVTRDGRREVVPVSVTAFAKSYFKQFDPQLVVNQNYAKWKASAYSKYHALIHSVLQGGGSDEVARDAIVSSWALVGKQASEEGTRMHEDAERLCNGLPPRSETREMDQLRRWMQSFQPHMSWLPQRTEWPLWWEDERNDGRVLVAGTLDLLLWSETADVYALIDFKRTNPAPKYASAPPNLLGPHSSARYHPGYASAPLSELENTDFGKYTMQLNILSKILRERYGIDVGDNMFLVQMHPDMQEAHCVQVPRHDGPTDALFAVEAERRALADESV